MSKEYFRALSKTLTHWDTTIMDLRLLLAKSITLLYRENQLPHKDDTSIGLLRTVIEMVQLPEVGIGINSERESLLALKETVFEMINQGPDHEYILSLLLQRLKLNCGDDEKLYDTLVQGLEEDLTETQLKRMVLNLRKSIMNHFREQKVSEVLSKASYEFKYKRERIKDIGQFIVEVMAQLEPLQSFSTNKDPAVMSDIDLGNEESMNEVFNAVKNIDNGSGVLKTGWHALNKMLQGGFRAGETTIIGALQHKYKTGFTLSLFKQLALYNTPKLIDPTKKPLLLRISFEDDLVLNLQFLYQSLKYDETRTLVSLHDIDATEMSKYVKERLQVNGFHVKLMRVDPTQWTYSNLCNKVTELEAQGYEVKCLMVDYLGMLPTTGCTISGPIGSDKRDLLRRLRNFCSPKAITLISPHQLSTEAKQLIRGGTPEDQFVKQIAEKGYWDGCRALDNEMDCELYIHICKYNKESYLTVQRGKHRLPTIIPDSDKYFLLRFPKSAPIPDDVDGEDTSFAKLAEATAHSNDTFLHF